jgi:uncharacterized protein (TIGR02391 family)
VARRPPAPPAKPPLLDTDPTTCRARLRRRIDEVDALTSFTDPDDPRFENAQRNIAADVKDIFGANSTEFERHEHPHIWSGGMFMGMSPSEIVAARRGGIADTKVMLQSLVARVDEHIADAGAHAARDARTAFGDVVLHTRIAAACTAQFSDGHYRDAILAAGIALVEYVKERSGSALDGTNLMTTVFSVRQPILAFNALANQTDLDQQQGMMHLFAGAVLAIRNPRAHALTPDTAQYAVEAISLISFLAKQLDTARRVT